MDNTEQQSQKPKQIDYIVAWLKKDYIIIVVCLIAILICLSSYLNAASILAKANANCVTQFKTKCMFPEQVYEPDIDYTKPNKPIQVIPK